LITVGLFGLTSVAAQVNPFGKSGQVEEVLAEMETAFSVTSAEAGKTYAAAAVVTIKPGWHINSHLPYQEWLIPAELTVASTPGLAVDNISYPRGHDVKLGEDMMSVYDGKVVITFDVTLANDLSTGVHELPVTLTSQACNDMECRAPAGAVSNLAITVGAAGTPLHPEIFKAATGTEPVSAEEQSDLARLIAEYGFWGYFLALGLAFVTGLLLSFSPCTYPMIPITVSIFAGQDRSIFRGFVMSLVYVGTMAVMYGIMGLIVSLIGGVFGAWLASTPVVVGIAIVFVIFALSMFGLYELQVPAGLRNKLGTGGGGGGIGGAIVLGVVAALVVSPCVGPFVAGILLYIATSGSPVLGFLILFVFALGLGTLYVIIGTFSSSISKLPHSGEWMESVKKFFGFVLLLMAVFFLRTLLSATTTAILTGLLLFVFGVFGGGLDRLTPEAGFFPRLKKALGILAFVVSLYLLIGTILLQGLILPPASSWLPVSGGGTTTEEQSLIPWTHDLDAGLALARAEHRPVLIDTWATWCANCKVLDKKTFGNADVAAEAERFVAIKVQLEKADSPITRDFLSRFGIQQFSLPTTLLLDSSGNVRKILRGVVDPADMIAELQRVQ